MAIESTFYDTLPGEGVKETTWAQSAQSRGALFGVVGANDFALSAHPSTPYTVNVAGGTAWGHGIWDEVTGTTAVTATAPAANVTRWDLVVLRRDWQPTGGGPSALRIVQGTATQAIPSTRENRPGIVADQPLWLVQWRGGQTQPQAMIDLRCWAGPGGVEIAHLLARNYLNIPGAAVKLGRDIHRYEKGANNVWGWSTGVTGWTDLTLGVTEGIVGERNMGWYVKVKTSPCNARIVDGMIHIRGEISYVNTGTPFYIPTEGTVCAILPEGMRPKEQCFISGTTDSYRDAHTYAVSPNGNITLGPNTRGKVAHFNGIVPLN